MIIKIELSVILGIVGSILWAVVQGFLWQRAKPLLARMPNLLGWGWREGSGGWQTGWMGATASLERSFVGSSRWDRDLTCRGSPCRPSANCGPGIS